MLRTLAESRLNIKAHTSLAHQQGSRIFRPAAASARRELDHVLAGTFTAGVGFPGSDVCSRSVVEAAAWSGLICSHTTEMR